MRRLLKAVLGSDVVVVTVGIAVSCTVTIAIWFFISWRLYNERYGVTVLDYLGMFF